MARLIWAPKALEDLRALLEYIARDAPTAAARFGEKLVARVEAVAANPSWGAWTPEDDLRTYREVHQGSYRIIYRVEGDTVYVVAVHHAARLLEVADLD